MSSRIASVLPAVAAALASCALNAGAAAQSSYSPSYRQGSAWARLEPIDQNMADVGHLGLQTRVLPTQMHCELDFGVLYRACSPDGDPLFARREAGVTALFPRSVYVDIGSGDVPLIPPGTTFVIGEPSAAFSRGLGLLDEGDDCGRDHSNGLRIDGRLDSRAGSYSAFEGVGDEAERSPRRGMAALLRAAARNERALAAAGE